MELEQVIVLVIIVYYADSILGCVVWNVDWFISDELESPVQGTIPAFAWRNYIKLQQTSVRSAGIVGTLQIQA
jgi:hypothetical protein